MTVVTSGKGVGRGWTPSRQVRGVLRHLGHRPLKRWGQHFLVDTGVLRRILTAAEVGPEDVVVEVGPGLGILTRALARRAGRVVAVELDASLADALRQEMAAFSQVQVVQGDILKMPPTSLVDGASYKVVANIPYYITSPILHHFLKAGHRPTLMVVMVQREVAEAIAAPPGKLGVLGISVQLYARPRVVARVGPGSFYPAPKVESALLRLDVLPRPAVEVEAEDFLNLVGAGFAAPRKQLRNSLAQGLGVEPGVVVEALLRAGISPARRPQTLSLEEWAGVWAGLGGRET